MTINYGVDLKNYQQEALDNFETFLIQLDKSSLHTSFKKVAPAKSNGRAPQYRIPEWSDEIYDETVPAVTLKAPTGAGKTTLAAGMMAIAATHSIGLTEFSKARMAVVAVPSKTLIQQTMQEYKDSSSRPHRILENILGKPIKVVSREQALRLRRNDLENNFVILVTTFAGFRRQEKESLKVYRENGNLLPLFADLSKEQTDSLLTPKKMANWEEAEEIGIDAPESELSDRPVSSLANLIRLERPIVIVDESHKSQSKLSWDMLDGFAPRIVIETSATPRSNANVLVDIPAAAVKAENMLRLPVNIYDSDGWQDALKDGHNRRAALEKTAQKIGSSVRPIALIQVERKEHKESTIGSDNKISVFDAVNFLTKKCGIQREEIAVRISGYDELESTDLLDKDCPVRFVVTVRAAAEGWDCPFAMVLCALATGNSKLNVEQTLGRIIRQYGGKLESEETLNQAYVFAGTASFQKTVKDVIEAMQGHGYNESDVQTHSAGHKNEIGQRSEETSLKKEFADIQKPLFGMKNKTSDQVRVIESRKKVLDLAERNGKTIPETAINSSLPKPEKSTSKTQLDISENNQMVSRQASIKSTLSSEHEEFNFDQIKNELKNRQIKIDGLTHEQISQIIDATIEKSFIAKDWTPSQLHMHLTEIRDMIHEELNQRIAELVEKTMTNDIQKSKQAIVPAFRPLAEKISQINHTGHIESHKHFYENVGQMNEDEIKVAEILEKSDSVKGWWRIPETKKGGYYLPGFTGRHYPDFMAITKSNKTFIIEYKGEHLAENKDTHSKEKIGELLTELHGVDQVEYLLVTSRPDPTRSREIDLSELFNKLC